ncbi:MAG: hypothetical protein SGBAC_011782 [Bacillariaceae sp.]
MRAQFYILMTILRDSEDAQNHGVVGIVYTVGRFRDFDMGAGAMRMAKLGASLPVPISGFHFCYDDLAQHILVNAVLPLLPLTMAPKFKGHYGSDQECLYALRSYGISEDSLQLFTSDNDRILDDHNRWYQEQKEKDASVAIEKKALSAFGIVATEEASSPITVKDPKEVLGSEGIVPKSDDVLFGHFSNHPGNIRRHKLVADHAVAYELVTGKKEKMDYALRLVFGMKDQGSRFLSFDKASKSWVEVPDTKARLKVSKTIRNRRR